MEFQRLRTRCFSSGSFIFATGHYGDALPIAYLTYQPLNAFLGNRFKDLQKYRSPLFWPPAFL